MYFNFGTVLTDLTSHNIRKIVTALLYARCIGNILAKFVGYVRREILNTTSTKVNFITALTQIRTNRKYIILEVKLMKHKIWELARIQSKSIERNILVLPSVILEQNNHRTITAMYEKILS